MKSTVKQSVLWGVSALLLAACSTPSYVSLPEPAPVSVAPALAAPEAVRVLPGDTLRIVRDAQEPADKDDMTLFMVRTDGGFSYPNVGRVEAAGRTPDEIAAYVTQKLATVYRAPQVTVNIAIAPNNRIYVGGAVRNPGAFDLTAAANMEQAIASSGGVLPTADAGHVALLRMNKEGRMDVSFHDYGSILKPVAGGRAPLMLQRGDLLFVPQSGAGQAADAVNLYINQLLPFSRAFGLGLNYELRKP